MQLMPVKAAFAAEMATSLTDLPSKPRRGQFLFPFGRNCST
jgi:hypothetical protein